MKRRITAEAMWTEVDKKDGEEKQKSKRFDIMKGEKVYLSGMAKNMPIIRVTRDFSGMEQDVFHATTLSNIEATQTKTPDEDKPPSASSVPKKFAFVVKDGKEEDIEIVSQWAKCLSTSSAPSNVTKNAIAKSFVAMASVSDLLPNYTADDLTIVKRASRIEVWTNRDFPAGTLVLSADTAEVKDRYGTHTAAALAGGGKHPHGKKYVFDGRLRQQPGIRIVRVVRMRER